ncbi:hypothetical protein IPN35_01375 [Candidatus Peregrinibacteria bacterium]|nr:MAG: hypothetical protein IPN35_01375 [Candidatus Peregrinibacteria bacterium]
MSLGEEGNFQKSAKNGVFDSVLFFHQFQQQIPLFSALSGVRESSILVSVLNNANFSSAFLGVQDSVSLSTLPLESPDIFSEEFAFLRSAQNLLRLDIRNEILSTPYRTNRFQRLETDFQTSLSRGNYLFQRLQQQESRLRSLSESSRQESEQFRKEFSQRMEALDAKGVQQAITNFTDSDKNIIEKNAELVRIIRLEEQISPLLSALQVRESAMLKNRDALLAGVQMDAQTARSLGLFFSESEK